MLKKIEDFYIKIVYFTELSFYKQKPPAANNAAEGF